MWYYSQAWRVLLEIVVTFAKYHGTLNNFFISQIIDISVIFLCEGKINIKNQKSYRVLTFLARTKEKEHFWSSITTFFGEMLQYSCKKNRALLSLFRKYKVTIICQTYFVFCKQLDKASEDGSPERCFWFTLIQQSTILTTCYKNRNFKVMSIL